MEGMVIALGDIPVGTWIHRIEMRPGQGAKLVLAKGTFARLVRKREDDKPRVAVCLPSGEEKAFLPGCKAVIGPEKRVKTVKPKLYKAGQNRWKGIRPHVRGTAKNPVDHPNGGKTNLGRQSKTPWGRPCRGVKTVMRKKAWVLKY